MQTTSTLGAIMAFIITTANAAPTLAIFANVETAAISIATTPNAAPAMCDDTPEGSAILANVTSAPALYGFGTGSPIITPLDDSFPDVCTDCCGAPSFEKIYRNPETGAKLQDCIELRHGLQHAPDYMIGAPDGIFTFSRWDVETCQILVYPKNSTIGRAVYVSLKDLGSVIDATIKRHGSSRGLIKAQGALLCSADGNSSSKTEELVFKIDRTLDS